jgi:NitT/TauT family transport system substrate-binding protein
MSKVLNITFKRYVSREGMNKTTILKYAAVALVAVLISSVTTWYLKPGPASKSKDVVVYALDWAPDGYTFQTGAYVALDKGWFDDNNIAIEIQRGYGSSDTTKRVASKTATFGSCDFGTYMTTKANNNLTVKSIGMLFTDWPLAMLTLSTSGINTPKDIEGKTLGEDAGSEVHVLFPGFCQKAGINISKVNIIELSPALVYSSLATGQVDALNGWGTVIVTLEPQYNIHIKVFNWADYGYSLYSVNLIANEDLIKENPDLVKRFVETLYRGIQWSIDNVADAAAIFSKYHPEVGNQYAVQYLNMSLSYMSEAINSGATGKALGIMNRTKVQYTRDTLVDLLGIPSLPLDDIYTNQFVE